MTRLLVSVRSATEAAAAVAGDADIIDVKEPRRGPLGRADDAVIASVVQAVAGKGPVTIALGELIERPAAPSASGWWLAKIGFAHCPSSPRWQQELVGWMQAAAVPAHRLALAAYADWQRAAAPPPAEIAQMAVELGCPALLIDTWKKDGRRLWHWLSLPEAARLRRQCTEHGLWLALAGSLTAEDLSPAAPLAQLVPDIVGVRGAACRGGRHGTIDSQAVLELAGRVHAMLRKSTADARGSIRAAVGNQAST